MDDELVRIVASAAAGLVIRVVGTTAWGRIRDRLVKLVGKGDRAGQETVATELDCAANELADIEQAGRAVRAHELESELRGSFRAWLRADPELIERLRAVVTEEDQAVSRNTALSQVVTVKEGIGLASGRDMTIGSVSTAPGSTK
jgi:hypothetical protein